jgi:DNA-binding NarL/FixJ family response regulator
MLSVQVHPRKENTNLLPAGETAKTEAWVVLEAAKESRIYAGLKLGIKAMLSTEAGFEVCGEAAHGRQALERTRQLLPDLVLLDIHMPESDGFQVTRQLRLEFPKLKVLIMSQGDAAMILPTALQIGADGCLDKTYLGTELARRLRQLLEPNTAASSNSPAGQRCY